MARYTIDWDTANIDGVNALSADGVVFGVDISTPPNADNNEWFISSFDGDGALEGAGVTEPMVVNFAFDGPVADVAFELLDVDANLLGAVDGWDDKITIVALDSNGQQVDVEFSDLAFHHDVNGNVLDTDDNVSEGVEGSGAADSVTVNIAGPIVSLQIIYDNDGGPETSGIVGINDVSFSALDGYVEGTSGDDTIDVGYVGDPDGDRINNNDAILPGEIGQDDIVLAGSGDDTVSSGSGEDLIFGGDGSDTIDAGGNDDIIYGDNPTFDGPLDFDTLSAGDLVTNQFIENGVRVSSADPDNPVMVFDSANPTGGDPDLGTGTNGNILILSEDGDASDPDDNAGGGTFIFEFTGPATINSLDFIDQGAGATITLYDEDGGVISIINVPAGSDNTVFEQIIGESGVFRMDVMLSGSGAVDNLDFTITNDGLDNNDDIRGRGGDDIIYGQEGDDILRGGSGNDTLDGGTGIDDLRGGNGDDFLFGGEGADILRGGNDEDVLEGGVGVDDLRGGEGDDILRGGDGADTMSGDTGSDQFEDLTAGDVVVGGEDADDTDVDTLDISNLNFTSVDYTLGDPEAGIVNLFGGGTITFSEIENVILCFTPGTMIASPKGEIAVEELKVGDRVLTRDNGIQTIEWLSAKRIDYMHLKNAPELRPIRIKAGALGNGMPERDMSVSPMHRMLVVSELAQLYFDQAEVLVTAKSLLNLDGVEVSDAPYVTYIHFMCERHELVLADGAWSESFQPGDYSLQGLDDDQRAELFGLFPELRTKEGVKQYRGARRSLAAHEAKLLFSPA